MGRFHILPAILLYPVMVSSDADSTINIDINISDSKQQVRIFDTHVNNINELFEIFRIKKLKETQPVLCLSRMWREQQHLPWRIVTTGQSYLVQDSLLVIFLTTQLDHRGTSPGPTRTWRILTV